MKILVLCTGNSCRSQMAQGILQSLDMKLDVHSAGTHPMPNVHPLAVQVLKEIGIDISSNVPHKVEEYISQSWDYVITVCGGANESCPTFTGKVAHRLHRGFDDPSKLKGNEDFVMSEFRRVRDEIKAVFGEMYKNELKNEL